ncbi:unnamed protein product [Urochloa humidicola]
MFQLKAATMADVATKMFNLQGHKNTSSPRTPHLSRMVDELGNEVWFEHNNVRSNNVTPSRSHQHVPVHRVFYRIKRSLPSDAPPTVEEVDAALSEMASPVLVQNNEDVPLSQEQLAPSIGNVEQQQHTPSVVAPDTVNKPPTQTNEEVQHAHAPTNGNTEQLQHNPSVTAPDIVSESPTQTTQVCPATPASQCTSTPMSGVAELFSTPEQGLVTQPPPAPSKRGRRLKKPPVTVSNLRRNKRQACSRLKHLPAEQRASHVLCRRLGYIKNDLTPAEEAIQEFVATFKGPMPEFIVAGLTAMFRLDDDDVCSATAALIRLGGQEAADTLPEMNNGA